MNRIPFLALIFVMGSCDMPTNASRQTVTKKETREFYLSCVDTVARTSYGRNTLDMMEECRRAATQIQ